MAVFLALSVAPVIALLGFYPLTKWFGMNENLAALLVAGIAFVLIGKIFGSLSRKGLEVIYARLPEPLGFAIQLGLAGSFVMGGMMFATMILGRTAAQGWFVRIAIAMGIGFTVGFLAGLSDDRRSKTAGASDRTVEPRIDNQ
jgi:hypothetical protein